MHFHSDRNRLLVEFGFLWQETMVDFYSRLEEQAKERGETLGFQGRFHSRRLASAIGRFRQSFEEIGVGFHLGGFTLPVLFNVLMRRLNTINFEV